MQNIIWSASSKKIFEPFTLWWANLRDSKNFWSLLMKIYLAMKWSFFQFLFFKIKYLLSYIVSMFGLTLSIQRLGFRFSISSITPLKAPALKPTIAKQILKNWELLNETYNNCQFYSNQRFEWTPLFAILPTAFKVLQQKTPSH